MIADYCVVIPNISTIFPNPCMMQSFMLLCCMDETDFRELRRALNDATNIMAGLWCTIGIIESERKVSSGLEQKHFDDLLLARDRIVGLFDRMDVPVIADRWS